MHLHLGNLWILRGDGDAAVKNEIVGRVRDFLGRVGPLFALMLCLGVIFGGLAVGEAQATDTNNTTGTAATQFLGMSVVVWFLIILTVACLLAFLWMHNPIALLAMLFMVLVTVIAYALGY